MIAHGFLQTARGMCSDERPYSEIDALLAKAIDQVKNLEAEHDRFRRGLEFIAYAGKDHAEMVAADALDLDQPDPPQQATP